MSQLLITTVLSNFVKCFCRHLTLVEIYLLWTRVTIRSDKSGHVRLPSALNLSEFVMSTLNIAALSKVFFIYFDISRSPKFLQMSGFLSRLVKFQNGNPISNSYFLFFGIEKSIGRSSFSYIFYIPRTWHTVYLYLCVCIWIVLAIHT